jgi:hypothetical protein
MSLLTFYQVCSKISHICTLFFKLFLCHFVTNPTDEQLAHVLSSADVARRQMFIAKQDKWQFVVKT